MGAHGRRNVAEAGLAALVAASCVLPASASALDGLAERRLEGASSTGRAQAVRRLTDGHDLPNDCLTPRIDRVRPGALDGLLGELGRRTLSLSERGRRTDGGILIRYLPDTGRLEGAGRGGIEPTLDAVVRAVEDVRALLVGTLGFESPRPVEILLTDLEDAVDGYRTASGDGTERRPDLIVIDRSPAGGPNVAARAAAHQMAHQILASGSVPIHGGWGEALAAWATLRVGDPAAVLSSDVSAQRRLDAGREGLFAADPHLVAGNALWLGFLAEAYGDAAVATFARGVAGLAPGELPDPVRLERLDETLARVTDHDLAGLLREFHLWAVLTGARDDGHHFSFAASLREPAFARRAAGLPSVAVRADPAVAPFGSTQIELRPEVADGGMRVRFEGSFSTRWSVDLVLRAADGSLRRLPFELADGTRGERTVPVQAVDAAWLLIRNVGNEPAAQTFTVLAHEEAGFPFELLAIDAIATPNGVDVRWETAAEHELVGFNVERRRLDGDVTRVVNPVWIPSLGDPGLATGYGYFDRGAEPGVAYEYVVVGITRDGIGVRSTPVVSRPGD